VRSSPSISTRTSSLSINTPAKQGPVSERTHIHPIEFVPEADQQSDLTTQMSKLIRSKIKVVAKKPAVSASSIRAVGPNQMLAAAAKTTTKASPQFLTKQRTGKLFDDLTNDSNAGQAAGSKSSPPSASTRRVLSPSERFLTRQTTQHSSAANIRQFPGQPSLARNTSSGSLPFDQYESLDNMSTSTQPLLSDTATFGKPIFKKHQRHVSSVSSQQSSAPTTQQTLDNDTPKVSSSQRELCDLSFFPTRLLIKDSLGKL
jgi:hypothetical protein